MKKIVAVVLALVMVLGLSTVAFADTKTTTVKSKGYSVLDMSTNGVAETLGDTFTKTVTDKVVTTAGDVTTTEYFADSYDFDGDATADYYACDATSAEVKLVKDGKVVAYLMSTDPGAMSKTATAFVAKVADPECGEFAVDAYVVDGLTYAAGGTDYVLYKGLAVAVNLTAPIFGADHTFTDKLTYNTKGDVVGVTCDVCKKAFKVVEEIPADYAGAVDTTSINGIVLLGAYAAAADDADKVESAETFDAGIAMYVGMSVMAAAGSAVVLKKKD